MTVSDSSFRPGLILAAAFLLNSSAPTLAAPTTSATAAASKTAISVNSAKTAIIQGETQTKLKQYDAAKIKFLQGIKLLQPLKTKTALELLNRANDDLMKLPKKHLAPKNINIAEARNLLGDGRSRGLDEDKPKPKVLDFYADWCRPCQMMKPIVEKAKHKYAKKVDFIALNVDDPTGRELMEKYSVSALPSLIYVDENGKMVTYSVGMCDEENIAWSIKQLLTPTN